MDLLVTQAVIHCRIGTQKKTSSEAFSGSAEPEADLSGAARGIPHFPLFPRAD